MFFLKRHKKEAPPLAPESEAVVASAPELSIRAMPEKFLRGEVKRFWTLGKLWSVVIIFMAGLIGGVYWLMVTAVPPQVSEVATTNQAINNTNESGETPTNESVETLIPDNTQPENIDNTTAPDTNIEPETLTPPELPIQPVVLPISLDSDYDELTNVEEALWGTDSAKADTDNDGYLDMQELINGYNPVGNGRLADTALTKTYTTTYYSAIYPSAWSVTISSDGSETQFVASPDEFVSISVEPNANSLSITDWYLSLGAGDGAKEIIGTKEGILSSDKRIFYFVSNSSPTVVYVLSYNIATKIETDFMATFRAMISNLNIQ